LTGLSYNWFNYLTLGEIKLNNKELIKGVSKSTIDLRNLIDKVSKTSSTVLIMGETGTGKELVAQSVHSKSGRTGSFVAVNCAAIPAELMESELFGHEKGAFTGADKIRPGRFEMANKGTLFLDEIGDMPISLQAKLLRAIENRSIQRVGGGKEIKIDLRLVCATHQNIEKKVEEGKFRADLFFRINVFPINVPNLAERSEDIPIILDNILKDMQLPDEKKPIFTEEAIIALKKHLWPGNVRELRNVIERSAVLFPAKEILGKHVTNNLLRLRVPSSQEEQNILWEATKDLDGLDSDNSQIDSQSLPHPNHYKVWFDYFDDIDLRLHLRDVEIVLIEAALDISEGTVAKAAELLKINRTTLIEKMKKLQINRDRISV